MLYRVFPVSQNPTGVRFMINIRVPALLFNLLLYTTLCHRIVHLLAGRAASAETTIYPRPGGLLKDSLNSGGMDRFYTTLSHSRSKYFVKLSSPFVVRLIKKYI